MTAAALVMVMLALAPRAPHSRLQPIADAIAAVTADRNDALELVVIEFVETTLARRGTPFGLSCCWRPGWTLPRSAAAALRILHRGRVECGPAIAARHTFYRLGRCRVDGEARRRARVVRRIMRIAGPVDSEAWPER